MLRHTLSRATVRVQNYRIFKSELGFRVEKRQQATGQSIQLSQEAKEKEGRSHRRNGPPKLQRPDFLQSLRVQSNPVSETTYRMTQAPRPANSTLVHPLRRKPSDSGYGGDSVQMAKLQLPCTSANHSQLSTQQTTIAIGKSDSLVDFFKQRLEELSSGAPSKSKKAVKEYPLPSSIRSPVGFKTVIDQAFAEKNSMADCPVSVGGALKNTASIDEAATNVSEAKSPIGKFADELKRRNLEKAAQKLQAHQKAAGELQPELPSWRKSFKDSDKRRSHLSNSFSRPPQASSTPLPSQIANVKPHVQLQLVQPKLKSAQQRLQEMLAESEEETHQRKRSSGDQKVPEVVVPAGHLTVREISGLFKVKAAKIIEVLRELGETPENTSNYSVDADLVEMVAMDLGIKFKKQKVKPIAEDNDQERLMERRSQEAKQVDASHEALPPRPPVVAVMGHVDHGKTTLMDALRRRARGGSVKRKMKRSKAKDGASKTVSISDDVAGTEAGGITQAVTAFQVPLGDQTGTITFLDTPGHAAFSAMRQSGSSAADIIVLVIAVDDGIQPQTVEILNMYKSIAKESKGGITMVVAMNKIDKPGINVEESKRRIENQLIVHDIFPEGLGGGGEYGAPVQFFPISAKNGDGLDDLIEGLALQSEIMDLRSDIDARGEGIVMDARVEQGLGVVVDAIVRWGSIRKGDIAVSNTCTGKVRLLKDVNNNAIEKGLPSHPVRIVGFKSTPKAGDPIICVASEQEAQDLVEKRLALQTQGESVGGAATGFSQVILSGYESKTAAFTERKLGKYNLDLSQGDAIRIPVVLKAGADGSVSAVRDAMLSLAKQSTFDINLDTIAEGVGPLTATEIAMAKESNACIFCFDVKNQDKAVLALAEAEGVQIHEYDVIYTLLDEAKEIFTGYLPALPKETVHGKAKVQAVFEINNGKDLVAGLMVLEGALHKSFIDGDKAKAARYRVVRGGAKLTTELHGVKASTLKKFKEEVELVRHGDECGLSFSKALDFQEGDVIECFSLEMSKTFSDDS